MKLPLASNAQMISNDNCLATEVSMNKRFWMSDNTILLTCCLHWPNIKTFNMARCMVWPIQGKFRRPNPLMALNIFLELSVTAATMLSLSIFLRCFSPILTVV